MGAGAIRSGGGGAFSSITNYSRRGTRLRRVIRFLGSPNGFARLNTHVPGNILLINPPKANGALLTGTITNRTGTPFLSVSNSSFIRVCINMNTDHMESLFSRTVGGTPTVIFVSRVSTINERENTNANNKGSRERRALGRLLIRVSNFSSGSKIVIVTTAGHPSILSPTLLHPNEFSERVAIGHPSTRNERSVLGIRTGGGPLTPSIGFGSLTRVAVNFANTSLRGLLGRTTLLTTEGRGGTLAGRRVRSTIAHIRVNARGGSRGCSRGTGGLATCRRTNRTITSCCLRGRSPIGRVSVVPHNVNTNNCAVCRPRRRGCASGGRVLSLLISVLNNHITRTLALSSISANTSDSLRHTARVYHSVITGCNVDSRVNPIIFDSRGGRIFLNGSFNRIGGCDRIASTEVSRRVRGVVHTTCTGARGVLGRRCSGLVLINSALLTGRGVSKTRFRTLVAGKGLPRARTGSISSRDSGTTSRATKGRSRPLRGTRGFISTTSAISTSSFISGSSRCGTRPISSRGGSSTRWCFGHFRGGWNIGRRLVFLCLDPVLVPSVVVYYLFGDGVLAVARCLMWCCSIGLQRFACTTGRWR